MANGVQDRIRYFELNSLTMEDEAPEDEMRGIAKMKEQQQQQREQQQKQQKQLQQKQQKQLQQKQQKLQQRQDPPGHNHTIFRNDTRDETRTSPPPMEIATNSSSNHPDFEAWKRDMTRNLMSGTVSTSSPKAILNKNLDWKSARLNKRRIEKKLLHQQLRSVKSDTSTTTESDSSEEDHSSVDAEFNHHKTFRKRETQSEHSVRTVYVLNPPETPKTQTESTSPRATSPIINSNKAPWSPRSTALERPTVSAVEPTLSPKAVQPNSSELAEIMVELSDLKTWAKEGGAAPSNPANLRKSTPPSSPRSSATTSAVSSPRKLSADPLKEKQPNQTPNLPLSIEVPQIGAHAPASIVVPQLGNSKPILEPNCNVTVEEQASDQENKELTITKPEKETKNKKATAGVRTKKKKKKKKRKTKEKRVRFRKGFVTETFYRPWTKEEEIDDLYFQDEELRMWEKDEATTLQDRFEVVVTELNDEEGNDQKFTGKLSIGTPVISFHNSYSYDLHDNSDEESNCES